MLPMLISRWWQKRQPAGFRAGLTLQRVGRELAAAGCQLSDGAPLQVQAASGLSFTVREETDALFLAHTVACVFCLALPIPAAGTLGYIEIRHTGLIRRQGTCCEIKGRDDGTLARIAQKLQDNPAWQQAMLPLDFRRCVLRQGEHGWELQIEHFAASELVCRLPPLRRYIRLIPAQRHFLLAAMQASRAVFV